MATMNALVTDGKKSAAVKKVPQPKAGTGEVLVKIHYTAQNPTDWKATDGGPPFAPAPEGLIVGCDFAGTIEDPGTSNWKAGQRVAGFVQGTSGNGTKANPIRGAYSEFIPIEETLVYAVPDDITLEDAAAIPLAFATAVQSLYQRLALPEPENPSKGSLPFLVYGGATSVGKYAIQLGKLSGCRVITTASPRNHEYLKNLGADEVLDYHEDTWPEKVYQLTNGKLQHALDCISEHGSTTKIAKSMSREGGNICVLLPLSQDIKDQIVAANPKVMAQSTIIYTVFERGFSHPSFDNCGPDTPDDKAMWEKYLRLLPQLLSRGSIKPNRVKKMGTLNDVLNGFKLSQEGQVHAEKLVYKIAQ